MVNSCTLLSRGIKLLFLYAIVFRTVLMKQFEYHQFTTKHFLNLNDGKEKTMLTFYLIRRHFAYPASASEKNRDL